MTYPASHSHWYELVDRFDCGKGFENSFDFMLVVLMRIFLCSRGLMFPWSVLFLACNESLVLIYSINCLFLSMLLTEIADKISSKLKNKKNKKTKLHHKLFLAEMLCISMTVSSSFCIYKHTHTHMHLFFWSCKNLRPYSCELSLLISCPLNLWSYSVQGTAEWTGCFCTMFLLDIIIMITYSITACICLS